MAHGPLRRQAGSYEKRVTRAWLLLLIFRPLPSRPNAGIAQGAARHGCRTSRPRPWMACGGVPPEQCRSEGTPSLGEAPDAGAESLWLLWAPSKVTRCKSGTVSGRPRSNGYVPKTRRKRKTLSGRYCTTGYPPSKSTTNTAKQALKHLLQPPVATLQRPSYSPPLAAKSASDLGRSNIGTHPLSNILAVAFVPAIRSYDGAARDTSGCAVALSSANLLAYHCPSSFGRQPR